MDSSLVCDSARLAISCFGRVSGHGYWVLWRPGNVSAEQRLIFFFPSRFHFVLDLLAAKDFALGAQQHLDEIAKDGSFAGGDEVQRKGAKNLP